MKQKIVAIAVILIIIAGITGVAIWQSLPHEPSPPIPFVILLRGNVTTTDYSPEKIVSISPGATEILFALGLGEKVVGVDTYSDYPEETENITKVGSFSNPNIEKIAELNPDLILATGGVQRSFVDKLEELGWGVAARNYEEGVSSILSNIILVGNFTGQEEVAETLVNDMNKRIKEITDKTQNLTIEERPRVYIEYYFSAKGYRSFGSTSLVNELIYMAGGNNVFADSPIQHPTTSDEQVMKADPEVIFISKGAMAESCGLTPDLIRGREGWDGISAVKNNKIFEIEESSLTRPGPRIVDALETLAEYIHPELFS
ncbi:MAG: cobalamin-binding protein [archaeon]|nr:cobalamin-binding protein [archaeon]MCP8320081.1 cobalamin-binding protein [archaeon]